MARMLDLKLIKKLMRKFTISMLFFSLLTLTLQAQRSVAPESMRTGKPSKQVLSRSLDTLFHFDGYYYSVNNQDYPEFEMLFQDLDNNTPNNNNYYTDSEWHFYYEDLDGGDTLNWVEATSWFEEPAQANDWIILGPLTIPENGATFSWRAYHNPKYRNGYEVKLSTTGMTPADFNTAPFYQVQDLYEESSENIDTNSYFQDAPKEFQMPDSVAGEQVYVAIHHNSTDMDVLHLSDFVLKRNATSVIETPNAIAALSTHPNPATSYFKVTFSLDLPQEIEFRLMDLSGSIVSERTIPASGTKNMSINTDVSGMTPGIYFYSIQSNREKITKKVIIQ